MSDRPSRLEARLGGIDQALADILALQNLSDDEVIERFAAIVVTLASQRIRRLDPWVTLRRIQGFSDCAHDFRRAHA